MPDQQGQGPLKIIRTPTGFLPCASRPQLVAKVLCEYVSNLRQVEYDELFNCYQGLEAGFHLVFARELCLDHAERSATDHKGKSALQLISIEALLKSVETTEEAFKVLARLLEKGRIEAVKADKKAGACQHQRKPLVVDVSDLVSDAKQSQWKEIRLSAAEATRPAASHGSLVARWTKPPVVHFENLEEIESLQKLYKQHKNDALCGNLGVYDKLGMPQPLSSAAFIGGGGGSDVIQAAALAKLLHRANSDLKIPAVISIRTRYSKSTSMGEERSIWEVNDKGDPKCNLLSIADGNLQIKQNHRGNARFVEDAIVDDFENVRLVIDDKAEDEKRCSRYESAIGKNVDSIFIVDTGGDVLGGMDPAAEKRTPDQDRRTQLATGQIAAANNLNALVVIMALGVDAPPDAQAKLEASKAMYYRLSDEDKQYVRECYSNWAFDGSPENLKEFPERYGKTPFAMLVSFNLKEGESRFHALPLPASVINDLNNPWACITWITSEMSSLVLVNQMKLLSVIAPG